MEAIDGQARAGFNAADELLNLRTTVMAQYRDGPLRIVAELSDSRIYGDRRGSPVTTAKVNAVELVQAFAEVKAPGLLGAGSTATITGGRFVMNLGSGLVDYSQKMTVAARAMAEKKAVGQRS